jgi:hypothetical protein
MLKTNFIVLMVVLNITETFQGLVERTPEIMELKKLFKPWVIESPDQGLVQVIAER